MGVNGLVNFFDVSNLRRDIEKYELRNSKRGVKIN